MNIVRRGFLKLGAALVGGAVITRYAEPAIITEPSKRWVEDKGDYYIVTVPDFKRFSGEEFDKPTIFVLGEMALVDQIKVKGFSNLYAPKGGMFDRFVIDSSGLSVPRSRASLELVNCVGVAVCNGLITAHEGATAAVGVYSNLAQPIHNCYLS